MRQVKVSVIIPNFNGRCYLRGVLQTLSNQSYPDYEIILVDDGSTDGSVECVQQEFPYIRVLRNPRRRGSAFSKNIGARNARGKYLIFLDNDVRVERKLIEELIRHLKDPQVGAVECKEVSWNGQQVYRGSHEGVREISCLCTVACAIRKEVFFASGCFDPAFFVYHEDTDLGVRLKILGYRLLRTPRTAVYHRVGGAAIRHQLEGRYLILRNRLFVIYKNLEALNMLRFISRRLLLDVSTLLVQILRLVKRLLIKPRSNSTPSPAIKADVQAQLLILPKAWFDFLRMLPLMVPKRSQVQKLRKVPDRALPELKDLL